MQAIRCALLLLAVCSTACRTPETSLKVRLPGAERWLMVAGSEQQGARWAVREGGRSRRIPAPPVTLFPVQLSPSPDGRYLVVISVGEGHPMLDILSLPRLLAGSHGEQSLRTIDPYPGSIELAGWEGARLKVRSDRPLTDCCDPSGRASGSEVFQAPDPFLIDLETGVVTRE